jgi:hypothetical protein
MDGNHLTMKHADDLDWCSSGNQDSDPAVSLDIRVGSLSRRGYLGKELRASFARHRQRQQLAGLDLLGSRRQCAPADGGVTGDDRGDLRAPAIEGNMDDVKRK